MRSNHTGDRDRMIERKNMRSPDRQKAHLQGTLSGLPKRTKSAIALSSPKREKKVRADTCLHDINDLIVRIRVSTRSIGTLTKFC